jgi:hypothetical protein
MRNDLMDDLVPSEFFLSQNYPNPFREKTVIKFCIPYRTKVKLEVFNAEGKLIKKLLDEEKPAGSYGVELDVTNCHSDEGRNLEEGLYLCQLEAGDYIKTKEMILLKYKTELLLHPPLVMLSLSKQRGGMR